MQWDEATGIGLGVIGTDQHAQGSPKGSWRSKPKVDHVGLSGWDLALRTDCDTTKQYLIYINRIFKK